MCSTATFSEASAADIASTMSWWFSAVTTVSSASSVAGKSVSRFMFIVVIPVSDSKKDPPIQRRVQDSIVFAGEAKHRFSISDAIAFGVLREAKHCCCGCAYFHLSVDAKPCRLVEYCLVRDGLLRTRDAMKRRARLKMLTAAGCGKTRTSRRARLLFDVRVRRRTSGLACSEQCNVER